MHALIWHTENAKPSRQDNRMGLFTVIFYSAEKRNLVFWCSVKATTSHVSSIPFKMGINAPLRLANLLASLCAHVRCAAGFEAARQRKRSFREASSLQRRSCLSDWCGGVVYWRALASFWAPRQQNRAPERGRNTKLTFAGLKDGGSLLQ